MILEVSLVTMTTDVEGASVLAALAAAMGVMDVVKVETVTMMVKVTVNLAIRTGGHQILYP